MLHEVRPAVVESPEVLQGGLVLLSSPPDLGGLLQDWPVLPAGSAVAVEPVPGTQLLLSGLPVLEVEDGAVVLTDLLARLERSEALEDQRAADVVPGAKLYNQKIYI